MFKQVPVLIDGTIRYVSGSDGSISARLFWGSSSKSLFAQTVLLVSTLSTLALMVTPYSDLRLISSLKD